MHDAAARNAALRAQIDQQAMTIHEIHQSEVENQKLSKVTTTTTTTTITIEQRK